MKTLTTVLLILLAGFIATKTTKSNQSPTGYVTLPENVNSVTLNPGDLLDIVVRENPSTGYVWLESNIPNKFVLVSLQSDGRGSNFQIDSHLPGMVGVGGSNHFIYKALAPGVTEIKLVLKRPWEKEDINQRTISVNVNAYQ